MSDNNDDKKLEREIRSRQKFSIAGAIGRAGAGLMKGASPISEQKQLKLALLDWVEQNVDDPSGALKSILRRRIKGYDILNSESNAGVLMKIVEPILKSDYALREFVRQVDVRWGEIYQERPIFQREGQKDHPDDEYTHDSVRHDLSLILEKLR